MKLTQGCFSFLPDLTDERAILTPFATRLSSEEIFQSELSHQ